MEFKDAIKLDITEQDIKQSIKDALSKDFNKRDNLRNRHSNVQFDCLIRGYIGEIGIRKWFASYGIQFEQSNYMQDDQGNIDIDLLYKYGQSKTKSIEVKTSLVPDYIGKKINDEKSLEQKVTKCIQDLDVKLIRRNNESIENLSGDIHIQIYFGDYTKQKDNFLQNVLLDLEIHNRNIYESLDLFVNEIYKKLHANSYITRTYYVGWIDKETLLNQIKQKSIKEQVWHQPPLMREFWTCKLRNEAKKPMELIEYIQNLK